MFKLLLITKLLRRKLAPLFAIVAVMLCTAMVIVVSSVMGGFLSSMRSSAKVLSGDVRIRAGIEGFAHYKELIEQLEKNPKILAATPVISTTGLIQIGRSSPKMVQIEGIEPESMDRVTGLKDRLHWNSSHFIDAYEKDLAQPDMPAELAERLKAAVEAMRANDWRDRAMTMTPPDAWGNLPGIVPGIAVFSNRNYKGEYDFEYSPLGAAGNKITVTVLPITRSGAMREPQLQQFTMVNEFKSGLYEMDSRGAFIGLDVLQKMLKMESVPQIDLETRQPTGQMTQARVSAVIIRGKPEFSLNEIRAAAEEELEAFRIKFSEDLPPMGVVTWEEMHAQFLGAVENEKGMLTFLFALISLVAFVMVGTIFYMIVLEKTRDIGVLRALGASGAGILGVFLGFGLAIGILGAGLGFAISTLIVNNLNGIQYFLANYLGVTAFIAGGVASLGLLGAIIGTGIGLARGRLEKPLIWCTLTGLTLGLIGPTIYLLVNAKYVIYLNTTIRFVMWDPRVYYFDRIPAKLDMNEIAVMLVVAVVASVLGALIPAAMAARVNPVESLRYE